MASYSIDGRSSCGETVYAVLSEQAVGDACPVYQGRKAMAKRSHDHTLTINPGM